jgi:hypothetical protein
VNHQRPDVETFNRLTCSAEGTLLAICRQGILRIAGDSLSWSDVALPEYGGLVVAYADAQTAFAGSWYGLYRSLDDGLSWQPVSWPLFGAVALAFADPATGVAVGEAHDPADGRFLRTIDGGAEGH